MQYGAWLYTDYNNYRIERKSNNCATLLAIAYPTCNMLVGEPSQKVVPPTVIDYMAHSVSGRDLLINIIIY